jgi:DNA-binding NarL/FixJ family response regulator
MARHFLLVEKSETMRKIFHSKILANIDDAVISDVSGNGDVFHHIEQNPCHLVLCSWDVTDPEGFNLVHELKRHAKGKSIPCIMLLLGDDDKYEEQVVAAGIKDYLKMPCPPKLLSDTINRVCNPVNLRASKRYSLADTIALLEQRTADTKGEVLNVSTGGLLCDLDYDENFNFAEPMMMSVVIRTEGAEETVEGLYSIMTNLKVLARNADYTPRKIRIGVTFVNTPKETKSRLEALLEKTEQSNEAQDYC